jgi:hypothetical protein
VPVQKRAEQRELKMRKLFATAAIAAALACGQAHAGDQENMGFVVAVGTLAIAECVAPVTDPHKTEDFNYLSDAMWTVGDLAKFVPKAIEESQKEVAIKVLEKMGKADFCESAKKSLNSLVDDARKTHMDALIEARRSWGKK